MLKFASICPHPPLLIPSIGKNYFAQIRSTVRAMNELGNQIKEKEIDTIIIISPHGPVQMDTMSINSAKCLQGDFAQFGDNTSMKIENDIDLGASIKRVADSRDIPTELVGDGISLDHGAMVPLFFLKKHVPKVKIVSITFSYLDYKKHFEFGEAIYEVIESTDKNVALVASGDLSHRLTPDAPAGYSPEGKKFDELLIELLEKNKVDEILNLDSSLVEEAGECGLRSIIILLGALSNLEYKFEKLSYEGPFGVGYLVGKFTVI
ncbi:MAG: AmmeMemoRadiSam system protein B [Candidatus Andersenbacteria bacterium]|nr:AmmeMemoRadiSam system protein B [Candidatus Andersenbacteria bacterium]